MPVVRKRSRMKLTTSQCRSFSSWIPFSRAICSAICLFHWCGSVRKPSASTSTLVSAIIVAVISSSLARVDRDAFLAGGGDGGDDGGDLAAGTQCVAVKPLEQRTDDVA